MANTPAVNLFAMPPVTAADPRSAPNGAAAVSQPDPFMFPTGDPWGPYYQQHPQAAQFYQQPQLSPAQSAVHNPAMEK